MLYRQPEELEKGEANDSFANRSIIDPISLFNFTNDRQLLKFIIKN